MKTEIVAVIPVIPSADIARDIAWYKEKAGFESHFGDHMYAGINRDNIYMHLQWHAGTESDPLLGGSVVRIFVKNIQPIFKELVERGLLKRDALRLKTPWNTNEFGFFDLNSNAVFFAEDLDEC